MIPSHSWLSGSFPNGPVDHRPYRPAQVSHQRHPPDHSCPQHGCLGRGGSGQEEVTLEPPASGCPPALGVSLCHAAPQSLPRRRAQAHIFPIVSSKLLGRGVGILFGDMTFSVILGTSLPTPVIAKDLDFKSGRMLRRPHPHGQCFGAPGELAEDWALSHLLAQPWGLAWPETLGI